MNINFNEMTNVEILKIAEEAVQTYIFKNSPSLGGNKENYSWGVSIRDFLYALYRKEEGIEENDEEEIKWREKELRFVASFLYNEKMKG